MKDNINKRGWFEIADPLTEKAPIHQKVSQKKEFDKQGFRNDILISPKINDKNVSLHFDIPEKDFAELAELSLKFGRDNNIKISIMMEKSRTVVKVPKEVAIAYHDYLLKKNQGRWGADVNDLTELSLGDLSKSWGK